MLPDMSFVKKYARKYGIKEQVLTSEKPDKKLKVFKNGEWIHFGHPDYSDYTIHRDRVRRDRYKRRAGAIKDKEGNLTGNDPSSPNYYSMRLLWDVVP